MSNYQIDTAKYIQDFGADGAVDALVAQVNNSTISFPFATTYCNNATELFSRLKTYTPTLDNSNYKLYSYYPTYCTYLPAKFRGEPLRISNDKTYETDEYRCRLCDFFVEEQRLRAKRYDQELSVLESWSDPTSIRKIMQKALTKKYITPGTLRQSIFETISEAKNFPPEWAIGLLKTVLGPNLKGKKFLDISAGWGDRLLAAMAEEMEYFGADPNIKLKAGHDAMIQKFGNPNIHRVVYEPFETVEIVGGPYDVVLSSPPYFNLEIYSEGQQGQSVVNYPELTAWMVRFLFASLKKAWDHLKDDGYLILHLGDAKTIRTAEAANLFIESLPNASWNGVIGLEGDSGYARPVWVWQKAITSTKQTWEPTRDTNRLITTLKCNKPLYSNERTMAAMYPELAKENTNYQISNKIPVIDTILDNIKISRKYTPTVTAKYIPDLFVMSMLESVGIEKTAAWLKLCEFGVQAYNAILGAVDLEPYKTAGQMLLKITAESVGYTEEQIQKIYPDEILIAAIYSVLGQEGVVFWIGKGIYQAPAYLARIENLNTIRNSIQSLLDKDYHAYVVPDDIFLIAMLERFGPLETSSTIAKYMRR